MSLLANILTAVTLVGSELEYFYLKDVGINKLRRGVVESNNLYFNNCLAKIVFKAEKVSP